MRDKYNLNTLPPSLAGLEDYEMDEHIVIPGMGGMNEDRLEFGEPQMSLNEPPPPIANNQINSHPDQSAALNDNGIIPGLDLDVSAVRDKKVPYNKPIPKSVQANWNVENREDEFYGTTAHDSASILTCVRDVVSKMLHRLPGIVTLDDLNPEKIQIYGKEIDVIRESNKACAIAKYLIKLLSFTQPAQNSTQRFSKASSRSTNTSIRETLRNSTTSSHTKISLITRRKTSSRITRKQQLAMKKIFKLIRITLNLKRRKKPSREQSDSAANSIRMITRAMITIRATVHPAFRRC